MTDGELELAREIYRQLVHHHPEGLSREALGQRILTSDRQMRRALEHCKRLAARVNPPTIIGFDPETQRYRAAQSAEVADRIIAYEASYIRSGLEVVQDHARARSRLWGEPPAKRTAQQEALFTVAESWL